MARQISALRFETAVAKARRGLVSEANESSHSSGVLAGKTRRLERPATVQTRIFARICGRSESCPISAHYRTSNKEDKRGGLSDKMAHKAPSWRCWRIEDHPVQRRLDGNHAWRQRPVMRGDGKGFRGEIPRPRQQVERARPRLASQ
jgi:hypothetical protein